MKLKICTICHQHYFASCMHCTQEKPQSKSVLSVALLLGLGMSACGDKEDTSTTEPSAETAEEPANEPTAEPDVQDLYGVPSEES